MGVAVNGVLSGRAQPDLLQADPLAELREILRVTRHVRFGGGPYGKGPRELRVPRRTA